MQTPRYVITGGAGFIGANLCEYLVAQGASVVAVDNLVAGDQSRLPEEVHFIKDDIRNTESLTSHFRDADVVIHLAALPRVQETIDKPVETHDVNVTGTLSVLEAARSAGVRRVVFASSAAVYGDQELFPLSTDLPPEPKSPYALHKLQGETMMRLWSLLYGIETVSLRFFNVYGPYLDPKGAYAMAVGRFLDLAAQGQPLTVTGDGEQTRDFIHVSDLARAIVLAAESPAVGSGEVFNVGTGVELSIKRLAQLISQDIVHIEPRIEPRRSVADITLIVETFGWQPEVPIEEGIGALCEACGLPRRSD